MRAWLRSRMSLGLLAVLLAGGLSVGCAALDEKQRQWVFQPSKDSWWGGTAAAEGMDDVWIDFDSALTRQPVRLHGLWLPQADANAPVLLYLHGARWDVRGSTPRMRRMHDLGFAVLGIDYRGFGRSTDVLPSEPMAVEDARAAWDWLARQHPASPRFVFGHSLGGAIAIELAAQVSDESGLMVEGTFPSIADVVRTFKWGWLPVGLLLTQRFDVSERIGEVKSPVLVVHGADDQLIPPALGQALYDRAAAPKRFVLVPGGSHHSTNGMAQADYRQAMTDLFGLPPARPGS